MADTNKANELNKRFGAKKNRERNVSVMDANLRAIERLVNVAAEEDTGIISVYRALDASEKRELTAAETDEIANAYHVETADDGKVYYITYKPRVEKSKGKSKLEHVNRSTPFVQMLLDKVDAQYSFLYCHSKVQNYVLPLPPTASGFSVEAGEREHLEGKNKYELFFLIECKDNIDTNERLTNIIDSVLLDVDGKSGDFFSRMSYASLEHTVSDAQDDFDVPEIDAPTVNQLNNIITQIRESGEVRQRILDFLTSAQGSELHAHMASRNDAFCAAREAGAGDVNALNSTVTCRMMPIGVFLNAVDSDRIPYTVTGPDGERAVYYAEINPVTLFSGHVCPHCGKPLSADNGLVVAFGGDGYAAGCLSCAERCREKGCEKYGFTQDGCAVCGKVLCAEHARKSIDSDDKLCRECSRVFRDGKTGEPLSPRDAAVRGETEDFVEKEVGRLGKTGALNRFKSEKLLRKSECVRCKTLAEGNKKPVYKYYLESETAQCAVCGERFHKDDVREAYDTHKMLCVFDRVDCSCGNSVAKTDAVMCAHDGCTHGFCRECADGRKKPENYFGTVKALSKSGAVDCDGKLYCTEHATVCKICGKPIPASEAKVCSDCGGEFCSSCGSGKRCPTCAKTYEVNSDNYKQLSSPSRRVRLNALSPLKRKNVAVFEDNETLIYVTLKKRASDKIRVYDKLTGKTKDRHI